MNIDDLLKLSNVIKELKGFSGISIYKMPHIKDFKMFTSILQANSLKDYFETNYKPLFIPKNLKSNWYCSDC